MRAMKGFNAVLAALCALSPALRGADVVEENLSSIRPSPRVSWMKDREEPSEKGVDSFRLTLSEKNRRASQSFMGSLFPAYSASGRVRISFRYRSSARSTYCAASMSRTME